MRAGRIATLITAALALSGGLAAGCSDSTSPVPTAMIGTVSGSPTPPGAAMQTAAVTVTGAGGKAASLTVEVAATTAARELGLMFRDQLPEDRGMLFLFASDQRGGFWMKDTRIPLTIAYLDSDGRVLELHDGVPFDTAALLPQRPYRYALEVNQGWFERHSLGLGDTVVLPPGLPRPE